MEDVEVEIVVDHARAAYRAWRAYRRWSRGWRKWRFNPFRRFYRSVGWLDDKESWIKYLEGTLHANRNRASDRNLE
jgi:hypothetical protein